MLFRQFCRLRPTISRGWSWHLVPISKRRRASRLSLQSDFRRILAQPSSLKHQQGSDKMVPLRGKVPQVRWVGNLFSHSKDFTMFFTKCYFKLRHRKRRPFISECDVRPNDFRTLRQLSTVFFSFQNFDAMLGFQSRDKWSTNTVFTWL